MSDIIYPFDPTGLAHSNLIVDELHTLTEINDHIYRLLIPDFSPFYIDNFILKHVTIDGVETTLVEGSDYYFSLPYMGATRSIGKMLYGSISINDALINGVIKLTYQTLGGDWVADKNHVLNALAEYVYNPRITIWDIVTNKTNKFPPINHDQDFDYVFGHQDLINSINQLADTVSQAPNPSVGIIHHLTNYNNPHETTKEHVGLGNVANLPLATDTEVLNRDLVDKYVLLKQLVEAGYLDVTGSDFNSHLADNSNPHETTKEHVGLGNVANLPLATDTEVLNKDPVEKYTTLAQLLSLLNIALNENIGTHLTDNNPHNITAETVGLGNVANLPLATDTEVSNQASLNKYISLSQAIDLVTAITNQAVDNIVIPEAKTISRAEILFLKG